MRKIIWLLVALVTIAAAACGGGVDDIAPPKPAPPDLSLAPTAESAPAPNAQDTSPAAPAPVTDIPAPVQLAPPAESVPAPVAAAFAAGDCEKCGGIFNRLWADPPTLDPHLTSDTTSAGIVVEIFSGLVALNTDLQLVPDIAERWEVSDDGMVYTFFLRENAKFHDGKPITASDFKWSIERAVNPDTASPVADTYLADIVGVNDALEGITTDVSGVKVIDDRTLQITIDAPKAWPS
jgi:ABC-type transport system substrate-binding protein